MLLSTEEIQRLIRIGTLRLQYGFLPIGEQVLRAPDQQVNLEATEADATRFFHKNASGARLQLTVGPYARSHAPVQFAGRVYLPRGDTIDLNRHDNYSLVIEPNETITLLTNEYVEFPSTHAGIVTPRVTMTDAGLLLTTAYIDPGYRGLLRITLANPTRRHLILRMTEPVAQLFVFEVKGALPANNRERLADRSVFYSSNWSRVLESDADPFPRRKLPLHTATVSERLLNTWRRSTQSGWTLLRSLGVLALSGAIITALIGYGRFQEQINSIDNLQRTISDTGARVPFAGLVTVDHLGDFYEITVPLGVALSEDTPVIANFEGAAEVHIVNAEVQTINASSAIRVRIESSNPQRGSQQISGELKWVVFP